jgi:hypothetical protein
LGIVTIGIYLVSSSAVEANDEIERVFHLHVSISGLVGHKTARIMRGSRAELTFLSQIRQ